MSSSPTTTTFPYIYGDAEQYLDHSQSESQSSMSSPYDFSYVGDFGTSEGYSTPDREADSPEAHATAPAKAPAKRKRENRYKNAPPSVLSRRRAQNRASQRAYRERKDQRIRDLEQMLGEAKTRNDTLSAAYTELHSEYVKLKAQQQYEYSTDAAAYGFDPLVGAATTAADGRIPDSGELDLFVYPDMGGSYNM